MNDLPLKSGEASPSPLVGQDESSQLCLNPSFVCKSVEQMNAMVQPRISNQKKRLKFDQIFQDSMAFNHNDIPEPESQDDIQIEFHISNCLKEISDFFKTHSYRYLYVAFLIIFLVNCVLESAQISDQVTKIASYIDVGLQIFFTFGLIVKFTKFQDQRVFWLVLDLTTNIAAYLAFALVEYTQTQRYLRAFKVLRLLIIVKESDYLQVPAAKLVFSLSSVGKILFPAALFIYFYAVIGLYSFRDYEYSKCRNPANKALTSNWTVYEDSIFLCGQKQCPIVNGVQFQCLNPIDYGVTPNEDEVKNIMQGNGLMRYNNIFYALFSTFKQTFITGSSRLMILGKQVTNYFYVLIYYLSFIYLLAYIYLNIFYGLMITSEDQTEETQRDESFELKIQGRTVKRITNAQQIENQEGQQNQKNLKTSTKRSSHEPIEPKQNSPQLNKTLSAKLDNINEIQESQKSQFQEVINFSPSVISKSNEVSKPNETLPVDQSPVNLEKSEPNQQKNFESEQKTATFEEYNAIMKKYFLINHIIVVLCSINVLTDYEGQTYEVKLIVDAIDFAFFWIYFFEMAFRIFIHMKYIPKEPFDKVFKIDFVLFLLCMCGLLYEVATAQNLKHFLMASDDPSKLLRTLKYFRIFILISSTPYFNQARIIFNSTLEAVYSVRSLLTLWLLVLLIFSIMGYHMFQGKTKVNSSGDLDLVNGKPQKVAFQGIVDALIYTIFIFYNEEWDWFLFEQYVNESFLIVIWQLFVLVVGLQVLSKYFMASLMKELGDKLNEEDKLQRQEEEENEYEMSKILSASDQHLQRTQTLSEKHRQKTAQFTLKLKAKQMGSELELTKSLNVPKVKAQSRMSRMSVCFNKGMTESKETAAASMKESKKRTRQESMMRDIIFRENNNVNQIVHLSNGSALRPSQDSTNIRDSTSSMSFLQETRLHLFTLLKSKFYILVRVIFILISIACTLIMNPHQNPNSQKTFIFKKIWYVTVVFFLLEIIMSLFAFGIFREKTGYLRNATNWIYIFVTVIEILSFIPTLTDNAYIRPMLSFRVLRIFVFIELKYEADSDMRLTMVAFYKLLPKVFNLLVITIIMYGVFAIILVKLYKDDFYYCDGFNSAATIETQIDCMSWGGSWIKRRMNVSNIFNSLIYLFLLATTEGWSVQVIESASLRGTGMQPEYGHSIWMEYFFSIFFFFGNMIMLNVFIGLSVNNFQKIKSQVTGLARLSKDGKMWFSIKNTIYRLKPAMKDDPPENIISQNVHTFMNSKAYKIITSVILIMFLVSMSFYTTNMPNEEEAILDAILDVFICIFIFEYILLWIANGVRVVKKGMFGFSTVATIYFFIFFILTHTLDIEKKTDRIFYGVAICLISIRCFTILNEIQFVRKMINSLVSIFPQTSNIWLLIFIVLFSYAVIGIYFFGYLKISPELNEFDQNYTDLPSAMYALVKFSTLESPMIQIIDSTAEIQPNSVCYEINSYAQFLQHGRMGCGRPTAGYIFFLSFQLIYTMILLSTLMAVIVDAYSEVRREQESMVNKFQLQEVQKQWQNYDPQATGYISYRDFWMFTAKLVKIYKVNKEELLSHDTKQSFLKSLEIPIYEDDSGVLSFQFHEVVEALTRIVVKQKLGPDWDSKEADQVFKNHNHSNYNMKTFKRSVYDSSHVLTLIILKSGLKSWKRKAVGNAQNQQNFQNLFSIAKKQMVKNQINSDHHPQTPQTPQRKEIHQNSKTQRTEGKEKTLQRKESVTLINRLEQRNYTKSGGSGQQATVSNFGLVKSPRENGSLTERNPNLQVKKTNSSPRQQEEDLELEEIK